MPAWLLRVSIFRRLPGGLLRVQSGKRHKQNKTIKSTHTSTTANKTAHQIKTHTKQKKQTRPNRENKTKEKKRTETNLKWYSIATTGIWDVDCLVGLCESIVECLICLRGGPVRGYGTATQGECLPAQSPRRMRNTLWSNECFRWLSNTLDLCVLRDLFAIWTL